MFRAFTFSLVLLVCAPIGIAVAQTPDATKAAAENLPQITEREVRAVQQALFSRGILQTKPSGVLDAKTRAALTQYQKQEGLDETGRIDKPTVDKLGLVFPLSDAKDRSTRRNGILPKIGNAIKDETTAGAKVASGAARKVADGARTGARKTADTSGTVAGKTGEGAKVAGEKSVDGAKTVVRGAQKASSQVADATIGRSDESVHADVREVLNKDDKTRGLVSEVKEGRVTLISDAKTESTLSDVTSRVRKISGVKSVVVINR